MIYAPGSVSQSVTVRIEDDGRLAVTGLVAATFPAVTYKKAGAIAAVAISLSDLALITTAWASGGVKEISGGYYRLDLPDAAFSTTANVTLIGDASGKHLVCPALEVKYVQVDARQWLAAIAAATATALAGTINVTVNSPATGGTLDLFRADSYATASGRGITITRTAAETWWPTTLSTVHFYCQPTPRTVVDAPNAASIGPIACTVDTATGSSQAFTLELTSAQLVTLTAGGAGGYVFWCIANKNTQPATLRSGSMTVRADPRPSFPMHGRASSTRSATRQPAPSATSARRTTSRSVAVTT
jgi:hypothetical protein